MGLLCLTLLCGLLCGLWFVGCYILFVSWFAAWAYLNCWSCVCAFFAWDFAVLRFVWDSCFACMGCFGVASCVCVC